METLPSSVSRGQIAAVAKWDPGEVCCQGLKQEREGPVEFVAEASPPPGYDLVDQVARGQRDGLGQVNAQVLERHRQLVGPVQDAKRRRVEDPRMHDSDAVKVGGKSLLVHHGPGSDRVW